jgi:hypothetical protein
VVGRYRQNEYALSRNAQKYPHKSRAGFIGLSQKVVARYPLDAYRDGTGGMLANGINLIGCQIVRRNPTPVRPNS